MSDADKEAAVMQQVQAELQAAAAQEFVTVRCVLPSGECGCVPRGLSVMGWRRGGGQGAVAAGVGAGAPPTPL